MSNNEMFDRMSKLLSENKTAGFGGAAVIVFPQTGSTTPIEPIELLILDGKGDVAQFLATLVTRLEMIKQEINTSQQSFGRR